MADSEEAERLGAAERALRKTHAALDDLDSGFAVSSQRHDPAGGAGGVRLRAAVSQSLADRPDLDELVEGRRVLAKLDQIPRGIPVSLPEPPAIGRRGEPGHRALAVLDALQRSGQVEAFPRHEEIRAPHQRVVAGPHRLLQRTMCVSRRLLTIAEVS